MITIKKNIFLSVFIILMQWTVHTSGQPAVESEYRLKAAFIYNFAKFVHWPDNNQPDQSRPFIIGVFGVDPFNNDLDIIKGKKIGDSEIDIRRYESVSDIEWCSILFIGSSERKNIQALVNEFKKRGILLIGDTPGYAHKGVMINFFQANNKLRFEINKDAAEGAGLKISSQLLRLGKIIENGKQEK